MMTYFANVDKDTYDFISNTSLNIPLKQEYVVKPDEIGIITTKLIEQNEKIEKLNKTLDEYIQKYNDLQAMVTLSESLHLLEKKYKKKKRQLKKLNKKV
jgi:predicted patatin/cPLA2 family phospholipase